MSASTTDPPSTPTSPGWAGQILRDIVERLPSYFLPAFGIEVLFLIALISVSSTGQAFVIVLLVTATFCGIGIAMVPLAYQAGKYEARRRTRHASLGN